MTSPFPHLLSPLEVGPFRLPNRVIMGSMHVGLEDGFGPLRKLAAYFAARARGGVGLMITGGVAPNREGWLKPLAAKMSHSLEVWQHRVVTDAVHEAGGRIAMQILHAGRYAYHPLAVAPSPSKSPITPFRARGLSERGVERTVNAFARCAGLAQAAGYDGVEIMGSEGYLINEFLSPSVNVRQDRWGGSAENRMRFAVEVVRRAREKVGPDFLIIFRVSLLDLVEGGAREEEALELARRVVEAGANVLNTGIGWHEARVPTIATLVPRAAFSWVTARARSAVPVPWVASNRINTPEVAEGVLARGEADLVSLARPLLADPEFVAKAAAGRSDRINTCIACNQACLDFVFQNKRASCLVNPRAAHETELVLTPVRRRKRVAVVGGGPAGLAAAAAAAERGHQVVLFEAAGELGGQFNLARRIPGKEEFSETLRYFRVRLAELGVEVRLNTRAGAEALAAGGFEDVVLATGVLARIPSIPGIEHPKVLRYTEAILHPERVGRRVALLGAGGIGFDVAELLAHAPTHADPLRAYQEAWGISTDPSAAGGLGPRRPPEPAREVTLCQRSEGKLGARLGKTTGWIHRASLAQLRVQLLAGCTYERIDDAGLHLTVQGRPRLLEVDHVVICAGQEPNRALESELGSLGLPLHRIGGCDEAAELDARRAIDQGTRLAARL